MTRRAKSSDIPHWTDQVKAQISRRYGGFAGAGGFPPGGVDRAREAGYPKDLLATLPAGIADRYSGCGFALEGLDLSEVRVAVDLGCGAGIDTRLLSARLAKGALVLALDLAPGMLVCVREAAGVGVGAPIRPVAGDMERLPFADGIADLVLANASFNLTLDKQAAFSEAARILRPGGRLVARDLVHGGALPPELAQDPAAWNTSLGGVLAQADLYEAVCGAGFDSVRISDHRSFPPVTAIKLEACKPG
jgi:SAM-dependent methyltransferase